MRRFRPVVSNTVMANDAGYKGLLFTGTDTGVGKTYVVCGVARTLLRQGERVHVCKPVATGGEWQDGRLLSDDTRQLAEAAGDPDHAAITPWTFAEPAAPPVAVRLAGATLSLPEIVAAVRRRAGDGLLLVEGVGGLLCPLTERETIADLAVALRLPVIVVTRRAGYVESHAADSRSRAAARLVCRRGDCE